MRKLLPCLLLLSTFACGNGADEAGPTPDPGGPATVECEDRTPPAPSPEAEAGETKPDVEIPDGPPPCDLVGQDIFEGSGDEAGEGATVTVHYVGVAWSTGDEFDSSWDRGEPATFPLSQVIEGWQEGIPGMREGGRRRLIIPPDLAYGVQPPPGIAPNETLVFVIDLIDAG